MYAIVSGTPPHAMHHIFFFLIDLILEPANKATQQTHSKFVNDCRSQMGQEYKTASTNSPCRKRKT